MLPTSLRAYLIEDTYKRVKYNIDLRQGTSTL